MTPVSKYVVLHWIDIFYSLGDQQQQRLQHHKTTCMAIIFEAKTSEGFTKIRTKVLYTILKNIINTYRIY